jgi:hypothetical protein
VGSHVNMVMDLSAPQNEGNFLNRLGAISFLRRTVLRGIN